MLGIAVALLVRDEAAIYIIGSVYLLLLFILAGYIDEVRDDNFILWAISYALPLNM